MSLHYTLSRFRGCERCLLCSNCDECCVKNMLSIYYHILFTLHILIQCGISRHDIESRRELIKEHGNTPISSATTPLNFILSFVLPPRVRQKQVAGAGIFLPSRMNLKFKPSRKRVLRRWQTEELLVDPPKLQQMVV